MNKRICRSIRSATTSRKSFRLHRNLIPSPIEATCCCLCPRPTHGNTTVPQATKDRPEHLLRWSNTLAWLFSSIKPSQPFQPRSQVTSWDILHDDHLFLIVEFPPCASDPSCAGVGSTRSALDPITPLREAVARGDRKRRYLSDGIANGCGHVSGRQWGVWVEFWVGHGL